MHQFLIIIPSHDYIADLHVKTHGKRFKTFKEWNGPAYQKLVQDMIGYANYVDKERKHDDTPEPSSVPVIFERGPAMLPLLPEAVSGVRRTETAKQAQEIVRAYFLRHYRKCKLLSKSIVNNVYYYQKWHPDQTMPERRGRQ